MISSEVINSENFRHLSTEELKHELLQLTQGRDQDSLNTKNQFYKDKLAPIFAELSQRNPFPNVEDQVPLILGVWSPVWSTIPFQDIIPGRIEEQSYQIFHDDGFYANMARYAPGKKNAFLEKISSILFAYDLMIIQKFEVKNGQWHIQNIGIKQAFRIRGIPFDINKAESWFTKVVQADSKLSSQEVNLQNLDKRTAKKLKTAFLATPQFEHLYIDNDFRLVKTQREAKQRPSYTIAIRRR